MIYVRGMDSFSSVQNGFAERWICGAWVDGVHEHDAYLLLSNEPGVWFGTTYYNVIVCHIWYVCITMTFACMFDIVPPIQIRMGHSIFVTSASYFLYLAVRVYNNIIAIMQPSYPHVIILDNNLRYSAVVINRVRAFVLENNYNQS